MSATWKKVLPVAILVIGVGAIVMYKNNSVAPATESSQTGQNTIEEKRSYDLNSAPITDAEISALVQAASAESSANADEEKDSALITSDNQALDNFNNESYVSTAF